MSKMWKEKFTPPDCSNRCSSKKDAAKLINVITRSTDEADLVYLATKGICGNPGKVVDKYGRSLLHLAASLGKRSVAEWLLKFKEAAINAKDQESGYTPLHRSLLHGHVDVSKFLIDSGANILLQDHDGLIPFDLFTKDRIMQPGLSLPAFHRELSEVYLWGTNANFNLGLGHQQHRPQPEIADQFRKEAIFVKQIALQRFHSAFLTTSGQAMTCGHGQGGRLGLGSEEPQLTPHPIKVPIEQTCIAVALGVDHSLFLMSSGAVWTCGSNAYHQLGHQPPPKQLNSPQAIPVGSKSKIPPAQGIGAGKFHSLLWNRDGLYTWGLNAGQIGHLKSSDERTIISPKFVTSLTDKRIRDVSTSDAAIVVMLESGDVMALNDFSTRRIMSTKQLDVVKMVATGGHLDSRVVPNTDLVEGGGEDLKLYLLTRNGRVVIWLDKREQTQAAFSIFNAAKELWISDFCVGRGGAIFVTTKEGEGFELSHSTKVVQIVETAAHRHHSKRSEVAKGLQHPQKIDQFGAQNSKSTMLQRADHQKLVTSKSAKSTSMSSPIASSDKRLENELDFVKMTSQKANNFLDILKVKSRLPCVYRAVSISCDPKGQNFGVLQVCPNAELSDLPEVDSSTMKDNFRTLFEETDLYDPLHDLEIQVEDRTFYAHKFILASSCEKMSKLVPTDQDVVRITDPIHPEIFEQILKFVYYRSCDLMKVGPTSFRLKKSENTTEHSFENRKNSENGDENKFYSISGASSSTSAVHVYSQNGKTSSKKSSTASISKKYVKKVEKDHFINPISALFEASKLLGMTNLTACIGQYRYSNGTIEYIPSGKVPTREQQNIRYSRKAYSEFHDVTIKTEDGVQLSAHRCVLAARLDYFRSMFATGCWIEGEKNRTLSLPVSSRVMTSMLDYIYSDEFPAGIRTDEPEYFCNLLVTADQFLVPRLIQMCERHITGMLTLKNVGDVLQFSNDFNAHQLKRTCMQFATLNIGPLLEARALDTVDVKVLQDLSRYYRSTFRCVESRQITPYDVDGGPSTDDIEKHFVDTNLTVSDVFLREEEEVTSPSKVSKKKSLSTGSQVLSSRQRTLSMDSTSSLTSESDDEHRASKIENVDSIFDDFEFEEKTVLPMKAQSPIFDKQQVDDKFLSTFFAGPKQDSGATTVLKVLTSASPTPSNTTQTEPKRFSKLSQKEKKKMLAMSTTVAATNGKDSSQMVLEPTVSKWSGWSSKSTFDTPNVEPSQTPTAPSLAEIMQTEQKLRQKSPAILIEPLPSSRKMSPDLKPVTSIGKKASWRQLSFEAEKTLKLEPATSPPKNPWKIPTIEASKSITSAWEKSTNFKEILRDEKRESENWNRAVSKPLSVTQIEERAIEELKQFYNVERTFDENIRVCRIDENRILATPIWKKNLSGKK